MNKEDDERLVLAKLEDKYRFCGSKNKIQVTDFLDLRKQSLVCKYMKDKRITNYMFIGGLENAERKVCAFYPKKIDKFKENINWNEYIKVIRITLPNEIIGQYEHRIYLGALMKIGITREKIGDILVDNEGADIIIKPDVLKFVLNNIPSLTRFSKAKVEEIALKDIKNVEIEKDTMVINISSMRVDNIVSELANCSRGKANEMLKSERVLVNYEVIQKSSKEIKEGDLITIRGKGKFQINKVVGNTRRGRLLLNIEKYC